MAVAASSGHPHRDSSRLGAYLSVIDADGPRRQLAIAVAPRWSAHRRGWVTLISVAVLIWFFVVPFQILVSRFLPLFLLVPLGFFTAVVATLAAPSVRPDSGTSA